MVWVILVFLILTLTLNLVVFFILDVIAHGESYVSFVDLEGAQRHPYVCRTSVPFPQP